MTDIIVVRVFVSFIVIVGVMAITFFFKKN
jgi:hypothetical protein